MNQAATLSPVWRLNAVPAWIPAALLVLGTLAIGPALGGLSRPLFVLGCGAIGFYAWRQSAASHLQTLLVLFCFASLVRRVVDGSAGFDPSGIMLVGPLLAMLASSTKLLRLVRPGEGPDRAMLPALLIGACILYGTMLSMFQGEIMMAATGSLKWFAPLGYGLALQLRREAGLAQAAAKAFVVILPIMGLYGIAQYVDPPSWDRYWMQYASITSAGYPEPYQVRVFSTLNGPASFATFVGTGLLLVGFLRPGWQGLLLMLPAALALLLSSYRTAWLSLAAGVLFCLLFAVTRRRALGTIMGGAGAIIVAATLTPFGEMITERLATLGRGTQDDSGVERLNEFRLLWEQPDSGLLGSGFTTVDAGTAGAIPVDGMLVACWVTMGLVVGMICVAAFLAAAGQAVAAPWRRPTRDTVVLAGLAAGALVQFPLAAIGSGELGFLFWTFAAAAMIEGSIP